MKLALVQMSMTDNITDNLDKSISYCDMAKDSDLIFFPEIQLSPFFPQYEKLNVDKYCINMESEAIRKIADRAKMHESYISPNVYLEIDSDIGKSRYDASLFINPDGKIEGISKMVHIAQVEKFYEQDYYTPSDDGFKVFDTEFGKIGIVICYDRHLPESIRTCVLKGAELIIIPTANTKSEPLEMFEWEIRVQAMQNQVFIAMCNRTGKEGKMDFAGESMVVSPSGNVICKADDKEQVLVCDIELSEAGKLREKMPYLKTRRTEWYM